MAENKSQRFTLPVVVISLTEWIKTCKTAEQLEVARHFSTENLQMHFGTQAAASIFKLNELCDRQAEYLKFKEPEPHEIATLSR